MVSSQAVQHQQESPITARRTAAKVTRIFGSSACVKAGISFTLSDCAFHQYRLKKEERDALCSRQSTTRCCDDLSPTVRIAVYL
jgi:hypothetical protein